MAPIPDEKETNSSNRTPNHNEDDVELEMPTHIIPPATDSSDDGNGDDDGADSDSEDLAHGGYMLLPQDEDDDGEEGGEVCSPPSVLEDMSLPPEPMTEVRGAGVDVTEAVAQGIVHPAFAANFPDNRIPVHLQIPTLPLTHKDDILWNQVTPSAQRLQLDSDQMDQVKSAMASFRLPPANIPDWAKDIPEDQWRQCLVTRLASSTGAVKKDRTLCSSHWSRAVSEVDEKGLAQSDQGSGSEAPVTSLNKT